MGSKVKPGRIPAFKERFNHLMEQYGSATSFAEKLGISRQSIGFWLNGDRVPDAENLIHIAKTLGVSCDWLLGISNTKYPSDSDRANVAKATGLSDKAVNVLVEAKESVESLDPLLENCSFRQFDLESKGILFAINALLELEEGNSLLVQFCNYIVTDFENASYNNQEIVFTDSGPQLVGSESSLFDPIKRITFDSAVPGYPSSVIIPVDTMKYGLQQQINKQMDMVRETIIAQHGISYDERIRREEADRLKMMEDEDSSFTEGDDQ